jgi:hypothetical protein
MHKLNRVVVNIFFFTAVFLFLFSITACNPRGFLYEGKPEIYKSSKPLLFERRDAGTIAVAKINLDSSLLNKPIGYLQESIGKSMTYLGVNASTAVQGSHFSVEHELRDSNYPIIESTESVFNLNVNEKNKPDLYVGGTVTELKYVLYSTHIHGRMSNANVRVKWQVLNNQTEQIIYEKITTGSASGTFSLEVNELAISGAICGSFREILADNEFVKIVSDNLRKQ